MRGGEPEWRWWEDLSLGSRSIYCWELYNRTSINSQLRIVNKTVGFVLIHHRGIEGVLAHKRTCRLLHGPVSCRWCKTKPLGSVLRFPVVPIFILFLYRVLRHLVYKVCYPLTILGRHLILFHYRTVKIKFWFTYVSSFELLLDQFHEAFDWALIPFILSPFRLYKCWTFLI